MRKWKIAAAAAVAIATTAGAIGLTLGPASAHTSGAYSTAFVDGAGYLWDDWGDHYGEIGNSLCHGCANSWNTDTVVMWQAILVAEGFLSRSGIDGKFGSGTATATKKWQTRYGLKADGKVGSKTWEKADNRLYWIYDGITVKYDAYGDRGYVHFDRGHPWGVTRDSGAYALSVMRDANGNLIGFRDSHHIYHKKRTVTVG